MHYDDYRNSLYIAVEVLIQSQVHSGSDYYTLLVPGTWHSIPEWNRCYRTSCGPALFPMHRSQGGDGPYYGMDRFIVRSNGFDDVPDARWVFWDDGGFEAEFYSSTDSDTPPEGSWTRLPDAECHKRSTLTVSYIGTHTLVDAYAAVREKLLTAAEAERSEWLRRGWIFGSASRVEQLMEVVQSCGQWFEEQQ
eukprot:UN4118